MNLWLDDHNAIITETLDQITSMLDPDRCCDTPADRFSNSVDD